MNIVRTRCQILLISSLCLPILGLGEVMAQTVPPAPTVEELLKGNPQADDYVEEPRCIRTHAIRSTEVIDDKHVAFEMTRNKYYLVQFEHRCPGLERDKPIFYEPSHNRLCRLDTLRGSYATGVASYQPGMPCSIPGFQSVTKEQLVLLKDALKAERRKKRDERRARKRAEREAKREQSS